jgi:hypothetical protein
MKKLLTHCLFVFLLLFLTGWAEAGPIIINGPIRPTAAGGTPPSFIQEAETAWNSVTTPKTTGSFTVVSGDILVCFAIAEDFGMTFSTPTNTGTAFTWTLQQEVAITDYARVAVWTALATTGQSMTVSVARGSGDTLDYFGANVLTIRGASAVGASSQTNVSSGAPTLNITTTQAGSLLVVANGDWNTVDGTSRTWRTVNGNTPTAGNGLEVTYFRDVSKYAAYGAYYPDAGAIGTYAVGLSAPSGQKYAIIAVEIKGQ